MAANNHAGNWLALMIILIVVIAVLLYLSFV